MVVIVAVDEDTDDTVVFEVTSANVVMIEELVTPKKDNLKFTITQRVGFCHKIIINDTFQMTTNKKRSQAGDEPGQAKIIDDKVIK